MPIYSVLGDLPASKPGALDIPPNLKTALRRLAKNTYRRGRASWETPSDQNIRFHTMTELKVRHLVDIKQGQGRDRVALTDLGREVVGMVKDARRRDGDA